MALATASCARRPDRSTRRAGSYLPASSSLVARQPLPFTLPRATSIRHIGLAQKLRQGNGIVIIPYRDIVFVFWNSVNIHDAQNRKLHSTGYPPIRLFNHRFYISLETFSIQNHHRAFRTESPGITAYDEWCGFPSALRHHHVSMIFILQRRMAQRAFLFVHQFIRPEHPSGDGGVKLFHLVISSVETIERKLTINHLPWQTFGEQREGE